jgi:hypothetical protein
MKIMDEEGLDDDSEYKEEKLTNAGSEVSILMNNI